MGHIIQLPEDIAVKIAAGEVVERPASVVKELIENALDAGATKIEIGLTDGGRTKIEVKDNGKGMDAHDAEAAFWRHGTSKIASIDDLDGVTSLGFRGEALATIGATARVVLETAEADAPTGYKVTMAFGELTPAKPNPPRFGTTVCVSHLFESVPARLKFLKSDATEWKACLEIILRQLLAHPEVAFVVKHNDKIVFDLPLRQSFLTRAESVWKIDASQLSPVDISIPHYELGGVVAKPEVAHVGKPKMYLTVNGHPINDRAITRAVKDAFGTLLPPGVQPSFSLHLRVHPGMVDVNVHPRKEEVRFVNGQDVFRLVNQAVSQAVMSSKPVFERFEPDITTTLNRDEVKATVSKSPVLPFLTRPKAPSRTGFYPVISSSSQEMIQEHPNLIMCLDACWLVTIHNGKLLVVDQHAAHERVIYNQLWRNRVAQKGLTQPLLIPHPLTLAPDAQAKADEHRQTMRDLGFDFDDDNLYAVPAGVKTDQPRKLFLDLLFALDDDRQNESQTAVHKELATLACKAAVKAGDVMSQIEMRQLVDDLIGETGGFTCPHGRPTHIEVAPSELEKLFKRTGF